MMPHMLDCVELLEPAGRWPAGTPGTVVDEPAPGFVTVEVAEELVPAELDGLAALVDMPASAVHVVTHIAQHA
jgi:hypothetical protein